MMVRDPIRLDSALCGAERARARHASAAQEREHRSAASPTETRAPAADGQAKLRQKAQARDAFRHSAERAPGTKGPGAQARGIRSRAMLGEACDDALLSAIAEGDHHAMRELFARHHARAYRFILRLSGQASLAEDVVNEVFLTVWRHAAGFQSRSKVTTWLLGIARLKAIEALRQRTHEKLDWDAMAQIEDPTDSPELSLVKADRFDLLRTCLTRLSPAHREIIDLVYYHDRSVADISRIVGIPEATVKTRMFYARKRLAELVWQAEAGNCPFVCRRRTIRR